MKKRTGLCLLGLFVATGLGVWQLLTGDTLIRQKQNMKRAREHVPLVRQKLDAFQEFRHIRVAEYTAAGGSLFVDGDVKSEADVKRVRDIVEQTVPPVTVVYNVFATNGF